MDQSPQISVGVRTTAFTLFLISMPLTVLNSDGPGFFADSDGWQGYEVAFFWPICIVKLGAWWFIPIGISTAYIMCGMWLGSAPRSIHIVGAGSCGLTFLLLPISCAKDLRIELFPLEAAWALAARAGLFPPQAKRPPPVPIPGKTSESN